MGRHRDDQGPVQLPAGFERSQQPAEAVVGVGDLGVVGVVRAAIAERGRRLVAGVGIEVMDPEEPAALPRLLQPAQRPGGGVGGVGLAQHADHGQVAGREVVVVAVEAAVQAVAGVEDQGRDHRAGVEAAVLERGSQGRQVLGQAVGAVVAGAVADGVEAGEDRGVRRQGHRADGHALLEEHALGGQPVEVRRAGTGVAVGADAVGAGGVEGHQQQVVGGGAEGVGPAAAGPGAGEGPNEQRRAEQRPEERGAADHDGRF